MSSKHYFKMQAAYGDKAEIWIYDSIGAEHNGITSKEFAENLKGLGLVDSINVYVNSDGGSVFDGYAIYESIRRHPAHVTVYVDGLAASIASVIALAGDAIVMAANSLLMIHNPWCAGEPHDKKVSDLLEKVRKQILDVYVRRTGSDRETIEQMMRDEIWMDAGEALALGFCDSISEPHRIAAQYDLSKFRNPPNHLAFNYGVNLGQRSKARRQMVIRAQLEYCQKKTLKILRERNQIN